MTDDDSTTQTAQTRWEYTNDVVTIILILNLSITWLGALYALGTGMVTLSSLAGGGVTESIADPLIGKAIAGGIAAMFLWLYGDGIIQAYLRVRGKR